MKLAELKNRFKNRYMIRIAAGVLTVALLGTGIVYAGKGVLAAESGPETKSSENVETEEIPEEAAGLDLENMITTKDQSVGKEETVYLISDADGTVNQTIVMEHLINEKGASALEDATTLSDIRNVKGNESFTQDGQKLVWQAEGNDIYYRGTSQEQAPVTQKVTYYLDGKEIAPEDLAGKSGKVTIRFDYENHTTYTEEINGEEIEVKVPFAAVTALVLDDSFENIQVTNGKIRKNGDSSVIVGYALPGLAESLKAEEEDFSGEIELPEYFEVTADVENFSLNIAMTLVVNAAEMTDINGIDTSELDAKIAELSDASGQLEEGSGELAEGLGVLKDSLGEFSDGMKELSGGLDAYTEGAEQINGGILSVKDGVDLLAGSKEALTDGISQLKAGSSSALEGASALASGSGSLYSGTKTLNSGAAELAAGAGELAEGAAQLDAGVDLLADTMKALSGELAENEAAILGQFGTETIKGLLAQLNPKYADGVTAENLAEVTAAVAANEETILGILQYMGQEPAAAQAAYDNLLSGLYQAQGAISVLRTVSDKLNGNASGIAALAAGSESVKQGAAELAAGASSLSSGASELQGGAKQVYEGNQSLAAGLETLDDGLGSLSEKVPDLVQGITALQDGVNTLAEGSGALVSGTPDLLSGMSRLLNGTGQIVDGVDLLDEGSQELADGMLRFNEEAIDQLVSSYNGDVKSLTNRLQAVLDAGNEYQTYTALAEGTTGSVKFIYKLASVR